jgi:hypothetical protein
VRAAVLLAIASSLTCLAQAPMGHFYATFASFQQQTHPELTGGAAVALPLDQKEQNWSFTSYDVTPRLIGKVFSTQTSVRTGFATSVKDIGPCRIFALVDGGYAIAGNTASGAVGGGFVGVCPLGKTKFKALGAVRIIKTADPGSPKSYQLGIGRTF